MERPTKRSRTGPAPSDDEDVVGDELNHQPEEVNQLRDPGYQLEKARSFAAFKLKSAFESIFEKYGKDFDGIGDEIDLRTGAIVVDNGHIKSLKTATIGVENDDDDESESQSGNEEESTLHGQESNQNATALPTISRPLPSKASPSPFGAFSPAYNSFGGPLSAFGGFGPGYNSSPGGPPLLSNTMYPVQMQFQSSPMPFGASTFANAAIDPAWRAPDLPAPVPWGGFWTPGTQSRVKTVTKMQQLAARTNHDQEGEDEDILLELSPTGATKTTENAPVTTKKLAPFRLPSNVSSPANHQPEAHAATLTPKAVDNFNVAKANGEKKKTPKRKTPARKTPAKTKAIKERITSQVDKSGIQIAGSPVDESPLADTQPVTDAQPAVEQTPAAEKPTIEGQASVVTIAEAVKRRRRLNKRTASLEQSADLSGASLILHNGPGQPYVQETIAQEPVVEKTSIDGGPVAEIERPSAEGDVDQSASISATANKSVNHELPETPSSTDPRTARRNRRLSMRNQSSPAGAKQSLRKEVALRHEQSLCNGSTNANTTIKYYSPSRGALVTKPSNQQLWVEIPVNGTLDPKAFQVVVDDNSSIPELPAMETGLVIANTLTVEEMVRNGAVHSRVPGDHETQTEAVEERSPPPNDLSHEVFTRNVVDLAYAFSDEDEPAIPKARVRRTEPIQTNPKPKPAEKVNVKEFGIPTPASSFDRNSQSTESQATSEAEISMEEPPVISENVTTRSARQRPSAGSALLDKTNTNSEGPSLPKPLQAIKARRGRKPSTPIASSASVSAVATRTPAVTEKPSEPVPIITDLASTRPKRQSLRLSRGRRDSDITIAESTVPQHATATMFQHEDESLVVQESPQGTPEPEPVDEHKAGSPASPTLTATIPASPKLTETLAPNPEPLEDSLLDEAIARQRFWSPQPESIILGHEPSPPESRVETLFEVLIPCKRMPPTSASPPPQEQEPNIEVIRPQKEPEQPITPVKTRSRRGRPSSAASLPTATVTTTTKVKTKTSPASGSQPGRRKVQTPSAITCNTTRTTTAVTAPMTSSGKGTLTGTLQNQSQDQTPGTTKSTKSLLGNNNTTILSLISSDTDDEDELTLDSGTPSSFLKRKSTSSTTRTTTKKKKKKMAASTTLLASLLRTPSRKPPPAGGQRTTTSVAKIASSLSLGRPASSPTARAVTPTGVGSEAEGGDEEFVGSEVIQTPGGTLRRCGEAGFRCDRDFCFGCL